jgi:hypothetical protein
MLGTQTKEGRPEAAFSLIEILLTDIPRCHFVTPSTLALALTPATLALALTPATLALALTPAIRAGDFTDETDVPAWPKSSFATLAFLVVFKVLIKLFFSIAMVFTRSLIKILFPADARH